MKKVKFKIPKKLRKGIPLKTAPNHTVRLQLPDEALTVHTGVVVVLCDGRGLGDTPNLG